MKFEMDPGEIVRDYRTAANKTTIVRVLADRNLCAPRDIAEYLADQGEELLKFWAEAIKKKRVPQRGHRKAEPEAVITEAPAEPLPGQATFFDGEAEAGPELEPVTVTTSHIIMTDVPVALEPKREHELVLTTEDLFEAIAKAMPKEDPGPALPSWTVPELKILMFDLLQDCVLQREEYATAVRVLHELIAKLEARR